MLAPTILVIEDDLAIAQLIRDTLESGGYRVLLAVSDVGTGLAMARRERPRAILLDLDAPGPELAGSDVVRLLRSIPDTAHIPIIAMSCDTRDNNGSVEIGDEHLDMPFSLDRLDLAVEQWATPPHA